MGGTPRFPSGTGNSPLVWNPTPDPVVLVARVRAGTWVLVELSFRNTNPPGSNVETTFGVGPGATGFFMAHVLCTPSTDDSIAQKEGGRLQPTMYGGSATKRATSYHIDPGWTFQAPWDCQLQIVSGGVSDPAVQVDVIVKLGYTPEVLVDGPSLVESMLEGVHIGSEPRSQRVYAPPVVGHPELVPATYQHSINFIPPGSVIPFPPGSSALQVTDSNAISPAPTQVEIHAMGNLWRLGLQPGAIEQLGAMTQGGASSDGTPAYWTPQGAAKIYKATVWSRFGC